MILRTNSAAGGWDGQAVAVLLFGWFVALYVTLT